jgi:hypothetical protein
MLGLEQHIILSDANFNTNYQFATAVNVTRFDKIDFFIYVTDDGSGLINTLDFVFECAGFANPNENDWARVSYETFDQSSGTFLLNDYVIRKTITEPTSVSVRCRAQGICIRIGIKANSNGGLYNVGVVKRNLNPKV